MNSLFFWMNNRFLPMQWLLLLLLYVPGLFAQSNELKMSRYTEADGLSSNIIRSLLQDSRGMLWIGTPDGLNYYDGYSFNTLRKNSADTNTIRSNFICKLAEDQVGDIWIGYLTGGVSCYNIATGVFKHYPLKEYNSSDHNKLGEITMLYIDQQNEVWIGVQQKGLYKLDKRTGAYAQYHLLNEKGNPLNTSTSKAYNTVYAAYEEAPGILWLATHAGLYHFNSKSTLMQQVRNKPLHETVENRELFLSIAKENDLIWLGSWSGGLGCYNTKTKEWKHFSYGPFSSTSNVISGILLQPGDSILVVSDDRGVGFFNKVTQKFHFVKNYGENSLADYKGIYRDKANNTWIASSRGLVKIWNSSQQFRFTSVPAPISTNKNQYSISSIFENQRFLLLGTYYANGLRVQDKKTGRQISLAFEILPGEENNLQVTDIKEDSKGNIWILTRDYIYYLDVIELRLKKHRQPALFSSKLKSNFFIRMEEDGAGKLWIASLRNGIFVYDIESDTYVHHYTPESQHIEYIPSRYISSIHKDETGTLWIGGNNGFLGRVESETGMIKPVTCYFPQLDVNVNTVYDISSTGDHKLWVGTDVGLLQYNTKNKEPQFVKNYTSENGITSDMVRSIRRAADGNIWCITQTSLCRFNPANESVANYGFDDGLENPAVGYGIYTVANGQLAIGTEGGYYLFNPAALDKLQRPTPILITSFNVNGQQRYYGNELGTKGRVELGASENLFSFEFASIDFNKNGKQRYVYMLEGVDAGWNNTYNRSAAYTNLQPGSYTFKLRAIGGTNQQDSDTVTVPIYIAGYFYKTTWFMLLVAGVLFTVMYIIYHLRLRNQRRLYQLKNKAGLLEKEKAMVMYENLKQQLNPHFLFNSLASLSSLIRINQKLAGEFLDGLSKTYRYILNNREKELVPLSEELQFSETYIKLQKTRFGNALQVNINVREEYWHMKIAPVTLQNLLENAIKHNIVTDEDPLLIDIHTDDNNLIVQNNLNKKTFVETSNRQGLASMKSLYLYLSNREMVVLETGDHFIVKIPLL